MLAGYAALTAVWMHGLLPVLGRAYAHDAGDPALNTWVLAWNTQVLPFSAAWWNAPSFYPAHGVTGFTELLVALNLLATPVIWLTHDPVLAYNVVFLLSFPLSGFAAYLLALELTGHRGAALVAGLAFGFAPYRLSQVAHVQVLASFWMPVALLALHRYLRGRRVGWLAIFAAAWLLQALSNGYYLLYFTVFLAGWAAWFLSRPSERRPLAAVGLAWLAAALPVTPLLLGYRAVQERFGLVRGIGDILSSSADVTSFLHASPYSAAWGWLQQADRPEDQLFPGVTIVSLVALGLILAIRKRHTAPATDAPSRPGRLRLVRLLLGAIALLGGAASLSVVALGEWKLRAGATPLLSVGTFYKPFTVFLLFAGALALTHGRIRAAFRARSVLAFYLFAGLFAGLACLGPEPRLLGQRFLYKPPYAWLLSLPGFFALRVPTRFWMLGILCLSVAGAIVVARLARTNARVGRAVAAMAAVGIVLDAWPLGMPIVPAPSAPRCSRPSDARPIALLQLPIGDVTADIASVNRAMARGLPAINGYSGYYAPHYIPLVFWLESRAPEALRDLASAGPLEVVVDMAQDRDDVWSKYLRAFPGVTELSACGPLLRVFEVPRLPSGPRPPLPAGPGLDLAALQSDVPAALAAARDGNPRSYWSAPQTADHWVLADLGRPRALASATLSLGPQYFGFPRKLLIEHSTDGLAWTALRDAPTYREAYWGALAEPARLPLTFDLGGITARFLRFTQHGRDESHRWSIAEIAIEGRDEPEPQARNGTSRLGPVPDREAK